MFTWVSRKRHTIELTKIIVIKRPKHITQSTVRYKEIEDFDKYIISLIDKELLNYIEWVF